VLEAPALYSFRVSPEVHAVSLKEVSSSPDGGPDVHG
jgi:hypothetical protein